MEYFYVISFHYVDLYNILFKDLKNTDYAVFKDNDNIFKMNVFLRNMATRSLDCFKIGKSLTIRFESFCFKRYFAKLLEGVDDAAGRKYCFIIPSSIISLGADKYIRKNYPGSKIVCVCTDLLSTKYWDMYLVKNPEKTDAIYTYDSGEAEKYGLRFINLPCSDLTSYIADVKQEYDLSFVGQDKGRLSQLVHICENIKNRGFTCNFHLVNVPEEKQIYMEGIHYHDDFLSFGECLKISASAKCMLELIQPGSQGNTTRVVESISIGRKLLSVNQKLKENEFYIPENMLCFSNIEEVPDEFITRDYKNISDNALSRIRPETFITRIDKDLMELDNSAPQKGNRNNCRQNWEHAPFTRPDHRELDYTVNKPECFEKIGSWIKLPQLI